LKSVSGPPFYWPKRQKRWRYHRFVSESLALITKGRSLWNGLRRALPETRTNLLIHFFNTLAVAPVVILSAAAADKILRETGLHHP
jgi:hypothetical protein